MAEQLAKVIPLFREGAQTEPWVPAVVLSDEMQDSIAETMAEMEGLYTAPDAASFAESMAEIKRRVGAWPDA